MDLVHTQKIINFIKQYGEITYDEVINLINPPKSYRRKKYINEVLHRMIENHQILRIKRGIYTLYDQR